MCVITIKWIINDVNIHIHTHTHIYIYIYIYMCVYIYIFVWYVVFYSCDLLWAWCFSWMCGGEDTWNGIVSSTVMVLNTKLIKKIMYHLFHWWYGHAD